MNPGAANSFKILVEQITEHCGKISVSKKESSELADLCTTLSSDRSLALQQFNRDDLKSELSKIEEQLSVWSKFNYPKSLMKRKDIETGIAGFVEKLRPIVPHGANPQGHKSGKGTISQEAAGDDSANFMPPTSHNNREPLPPQITEPETEESHLIEASQPLSVKRLDGEVTINGKIPLSGGTHCELWQGLWRRGRSENAGEEKVALKALLKVRSPEKAQERLERKLPSWAELRHPNILPFYGTYTDAIPRLHMVFPLQENGNLLEYVKAKAQANKNYLLSGSADGLSYLHSKNIVHGNVKCNNVLVSQEGEPQICDFEMAEILGVGNENTNSGTGSSPANLARYAAPELIENPKLPATTFSDTYSFAMLILECITEDLPFPNIHRNAAVVHARINKKQCPTRPGGEDRRKWVSDGLWNLMRRCWSAEPKDRPTMKRVQHFIKDQSSHNDT